jgi:hypothetical protein
MKMYLKVPILLQGGKVKYIVYTENRIWYMRRVK